MAICINRESPGYLSIYQLQREWTEFTYFINPVISLDITIFFEANNGVYSLNPRSGYSHNSIRQKTR